MSIFEELTLITMKKLLYAIPFLFLLTACPIGLDYAPDTLEAEKVNPALQGTWTCDITDAETRKVEITKLTPTKYKVTVLERGELYALETDILYLYETTLDGLHILYLKPDNEDKYYLYQYVLDGEKLELADIPLLDGGVDAVTSTEALRSQIASSMKMEDFRKDVLTYRK